MNLPETTSCNAVTHPDKSRGKKRSPAWLAEQVHVSLPAAGNWLADTFLPRPKRLGEVAACLDCQNDEMEEWIIAAGYNPKEVVQAAESYVSKKLHPPSAVEALTDAVILKLQTDDSFREFMGQYDQELVELIGRRKQ